MSKVRSHYDNLQVSRSASDSVIKAAFRSLAQAHHPDRIPEDRQNAERIMKIINEAYAVLSDPSKRREHDEWLAREEEEFAQAEQRKRESESVLQADAVRRKAQRQAHIPPSANKLAIAVFVGVVGIIFLTSWFSQRTGELHPVPNQAVGSPTTTEVVRPALIDLEPFTVALVPSANKESYLQVRFAIKIDDVWTHALRAEEMKIRNDISRLLSAKTAEQLIPRAGKEHLAVEVLSALNNVLAPPGSGLVPPVKEVLFTSFIIQE